MNNKSYNNTNFPITIKNLMDNIYNDYNITQTHTNHQSKNINLRLNQILPYKYFIENKDSRGLLLAHAMGEGKTKIAVECAKAIHNKYPNKKIIILLPKSLEANFRKNFDEHFDVSYISLNASNMSKQIEDINKTRAEVAYERRIKEFLKDIKKANTLNNTFLIIDEAHNFFNSITNGGRNAIKLYDMIMKARDIRLLFLTGTPIINHPFELVPCFNMLRGPMRGGYLFSESFKDFSNWFIEKTAGDKSRGIKGVPTGKIKNRVKFMNRIFGLTSYYGDLYFDKTNHKGFPTKLTTIIEKIAMSQEQFTQYFAAREAELEENTKSYRQTEARFSSSTKGSSTYRVKSRQISNWAFPPYALGEHRGRKTRKKYLSKVKHDDLTKNLSKWSPKMLKLLNNIKNKKNQLSIVYSQFVSGEGLAVFSRILEANGYLAYNTTYQHKKDFGKDLSGFEDINKTKSKQKYFAMLTGNVSNEHRGKIITLFNDSDNAHGEYIQILLLSSAVAEGIDLKRVRNVHIMEPFWNYARINQVETRAIRFKSHEDLPKNEQNVQVYIYLSTYPTKYKRTNKPGNNTHKNSKIVEEYTTDVELFKNSVARMKLINEFLLTLAETSIDCNIHLKFNNQVNKHIPVKCKLCAPTNQQLFIPNINQDMAHGDNNCTEYIEKKIKVKKILINTNDEGTPNQLEYYYKEDDGGFTIYEKKSIGYIKMNRDNPYYAQIMAKLIFQTEDKKS